MRGLGGGDWGGGGQSAGCELRVPGPAVHWTLDSKAQYRTTRSGAEQRASAPAADMDTLSARYIRTSRSRGASDRKRPSPSPDMRDDTSRSQDAKNILFFSRVCSGCFCPLFLRVEMSEWCEGCDRDEN